MTAPPIRLPDQEPAAPQSASGAQRSALWEFLVPPSAFGRADRHAVRAEGTRLWFADGTSALCGTSGLWNVNLGYGNPAVAEAIARALRDASYLTLFRYSHRYAAEAAAALVAACGPDVFGRAVFSTSGSAANDLMMKLVRHCFALRAEPGRRLVVGLHGGYHGLTYGSFSLTGEDLGQQLYGVDRRLVRHVGHENPAELRTLLQREGRRIAAVVVEPVLGSGARVLSDEFVAELLRLRDQHGFLLVADEVATGFGRTGRFFAHQGWPGTPDLVVVSKGLTNGTCAAAAVVVSHEVCAAFDDADAVLVHGETQAGTPPTCAAIVATLEFMREHGVVARAAKLGLLLDDALEDLRRRHRLVTAVGGAGCFRALHLAGSRAGEPAAPAQIEAVVGLIRNAGAVVHPGPGCIQLIPALIYTDDDLRLLLDCVERGLRLFERSTG